MAVDASSSAASAATQSQNDAWRPQHPQRCTAAAQSTPPQPARRKDANSPTSVIDARDDKQFAPLGAAQNHAVARAALLGVALTLGVLLVMLLALGGAYPALVGPGLLALGFGLRHGVDCDHIAAIDNVTRKLSAARTRRGTYIPSQRGFASTASTRESTGRLLASLVSIARRRGGRQLW